MKSILQLLCLLLCGVVLPAGCFSGAAAEEMSLYVLNVGKADSMILRSGDNCYLIDTGRGKTWEITEAAMAAEGITHLDAVIITHMDSDHVGGLKKMLKSDITADHLYIPPFFLPEKEDEENPAVKAAGKRDAEVEYLHAGDTLPLGAGSLTVIGPLTAARDKEDNNSLVLVAEAASGRFLLAGDMEFPEEAELLAAGVIPRADVLKVANHGDDDTNSDALMRAVQPKIAVISTSTAEKESTPARRVMELLDQWGVTVYQTQHSQTGVLLTLRDGELQAEIR